LVIRSRKGITETASRRIVYAIRVSFEVVGGAFRLEYSVPRVNFCGSNGCYVGTSWFGISLSHEEGQLSGMRGGRKLTRQGIED